MAEFGQSLKQFFAAGTYRIPKFQRDYSWQKDQIAEFWDDAWNAWIEKTESYFFGPVVLINEKKEQIHIHSFSRWQHPYWQPQSHQ